MCGKTMMDKIKNQEFREKLGVAPLSVMMCKNRLRWFEHVQRKPIEAPIRRIETIIVEVKGVEEDLRKRGSSKLRTT